jgi:hypothetical protein
MRASTLLGTALCLSACASAPPPTAKTVSAPQPPIAAVSVSAAPRELPADATFADLVRAARLAIQAGRADSGTGCLLTRRGRDLELSADLMPALDELPDPARDLDTQLQRQLEPIRVLSAWGQIGRLQPGLVLAAFTTFGAENLQAVGLALLLTDQGVYLRYSDASADARDGPLALESAIARLLAAPHNAEAALYLSAEADLPLAKLIELLRLLPGQRSVTFALALPSGTHVPTQTVQLTPQRCPDGLPEPIEGSDEGELAASAIVPALAPLRVQAQACLEQARGAARAGGRLTLAMRIAADGRVQESCVQEDASGDAQLELCILTSARALQFPVPAPAGFVDVRLPLSLTPASVASQRALCE